MGFTTTMDMKIPECLEAQGQEQMEQMEHTDLEQMDPQERKVVLTFFAPGA
jgi:hypothetical protein